MSATKHRELLVVNTRFNLVADRVDKVIAILLDMESYKVCPEHSVQQLCTPWADIELRGGRPRNVPKERYEGIGAALFDDLGHECKMIILHKNDGTLDVAYFIQQCFCELCVHFFILYPV